MLFILLSAVSAVSLTALILNVVLSLPVSWKNILLSPWQPPDSHMVAVQTIMSQWESCLIYCISPLHHGQSCNCSVIIQHHERQGRFWSKTFFKSVFSLCLCWFFCFVWGLFVFVHKWKNILDTNELSDSSMRCFQTSSCGLDIDLKTTNIYYSSLRLIVLLDSQCSNIWTELCVCKSGL